MMKFTSCLMTLALVLIAGTHSTDAQDKPAPIKKRADLFGPDKLWDVHLKLSAKEYDAMQPKKGAIGFGFPMKDAPPKKEEKKDENADVHKNKGFGIEFPWVKGTIDFEGTVVTDVGIRYKGNSTYQTSAQGLKRPFKIDVNHFVEGQKLHGLNGFGLGNGVMDPARLREALAFSLFRAAKVPAPRTAYAKVYLTVADKYDKTYVGVYTMIESIDKPFLKEHFKSDKGMLLKPERIQGLPHFGDKWDMYKDRYNPKRDTTEAQQRRLMEFTKLVNNADDKEFNKKISEYLDVDGFLRFAAVNSLIANLDSFFGLGHNYYMYLSPKTNQFHFMPWDLDLSFGGFGFGGPDQAEWAIAKPYTGNNKLTERVLAIKKYNDAYRGHLKTLTSGAFSPKELDATITKLEATIKDALAKEPKGGGGPMFAFGPGGNKQDLRDFTKKRAESVIAQLDGKSEGKQLAGMGFGGGVKFGGFGLGNMLAKPIFEFTDANKDGKVTLDEFKNAAGKLFKEAGGDDKTSVAESQLAETINKLMPQPKGFGDFKPPPPPKGFGPGDRIAVALLKEAQAGDDKKLTRDQFMTGAEKLFKRWDKDKKGHLDEKKLADGINEIMPPPKFVGGPGFGAFGMGPALVKPIVENVDTNKDGKLSLDEFKVAAAKLFKEAGGDDRTPIAEKDLAETIDKLMPQPKGFGGFQPPPPPKGFGPGKRIATAILKHAGAGEDKKLTREQFVAGADKLFKQWDKDKNGFLDEKEIVDGLNQFIPPPEFGPGIGFGPAPPPPGADPKKDKQ